MGGQGVHIRRAKGRAKGHFPYYLSSIFLISSQITFPANTLISSETRNILLLNNETRGIYLRNEKLWAPYDNQKRARTIFSETCKCIISALSKRQ